MNESEARVAAALDDLHVPWLYEPTLFVLETDDAGNCTHGFKPDFYLPEHDLYVEVTMARQAHTTRKNRKARLARELHGVQVELIYRADFQRLPERLAEVLQPDDEHEQQERTNH